MNSLINKITKAEMADVHENEPFLSHRFKGVLLEVTGKRRLGTKKYKERIWLSRTIAAKLNLIPKDYGHLHDDEINEHLKKNTIGKIINLKSVLKTKLI